MLEHQFYWRLIFIVIFGTILVSTMISFAKHNSVEELPKKRIVLKVLGVLFLILAMLCGVSSIVNLVDLTHPTEMVGPYIHRNMIVRHTSVPLIWGYTTTEQESVISAINCFFMFLSLAAYLFCFRKSPSAWWKKFLKVFYVILLFTFFCSSTNFHFFDIYEWSAGVAFVVMLVGLRWRMEYGIKDKKKEEKIEIIVTKNNLKEYMVKMLSEINDKRNVIIFKYVIPVVLAGFMIFSGFYYISFVKYFDEEHLFLFPSVVIVILVLYYMFRYFLIRVKRDKNLDRRKHIKNIIWSILFGLLFIISLSGGIFYSICGIEEGGDYLTERNNIKEEFYETLESGTLGEKLIISVECLNYFHFCSGRGLSWRDMIKEAKQLEIELLDDFRNRATNGEAHAQYVLGVYYTKKKDSERANYWYLTAAEQGNSYAQYEIGLYYSEYIRISNNYKRRDINKALFWLKQAGEQDHINALLLLGDIYRDVEYYDTAKIYWKQAASLGSEEALKKIEKIYE